MTSSPASAASLPQRLSAKEWNIRLGANEELIALLDDANDANVAEFSKYVPYLKKIVVDPYPPVKEKAMDALLIFMSKFNYQSVIPANFGGDLASILIDKCLSARDSIKTKTVEALLLLIENGSADVVVSELCRVATTHKVPKISSLCVFTLREAVMQFGFGPGCIPSEHVLPILEACFEHPFKDMRTEAFALTVEIYRWMGPALRPHIKGLRPTQQKELDVAFDMLPPDSRQSLVPVRTIKKTGPTPSSSPISVPTTGLVSSGSSSSINSSPSVQASLAALKSNPKRRSLSIPKAVQLHASPSQSPTTGSSPSTHSPLVHNSSLSHIPTPSSHGSPAAGGTPPSQIPIRRSLTNMQLTVSTPNQSPQSTPTSASNRSSVSLTHDEAATALDSDYFGHEADLSGDTESGLTDTEYQNLPPVDLLSSLTSDWYKTLTDSGGTWHTRKAQVDQLISLVPPGSPLKGNTNEYSKLVGCLTRLLADPNISVQQSALRGIEVLAHGLRSDFALHAKRLAPFLLEKFKDKKSTIVEIVHSLLDLFHQLQCFSVADVIEPVLSTLSSKNPQMKYECLLWLERVIPTTSRQVLLQVATPLCDSLVKGLDDSVVAVMNAASRAFVWVTETLGEQAAKPFVDSLSRQHLSKLKEVKEINSFKRDPPKPVGASSKPTPRPTYTRTHSSKSLIPLPKSSPMRQSSEYFDEAEPHAPTANGDDSISDFKLDAEHKEEEPGQPGRPRRDSMDSPFNESNSVYQVLHTMRQEITSFTAKMNSTVESFERHLKEKDGRRKEEAQFIQEYDKELHSWNEDLQSKNKVVMDELQQERKQRQALEARVAQLEEQLQNAANHSQASSLSPSFSEAEVQEKFALLEELETVTLEKDEAMSQLGLERAKFSDDVEWLASLDDDDLDRLEEDHQRTMEAISRAKELKANGEM